MVDVSLPNKVYKLILLDRDGVINTDITTSVRSLDEFHFIPASLKAIAHLSQKGCKIAIVTNQAVVGRGDLSENDLQDIHHHLHQHIKQAGGHLDKIYVCTDTTCLPHNRRKPAPGMILEALQDFQVRAEETLMIGDALRDLQAAHRAGVESVLVRTGKGSQTEQDLKGVSPIGIYKDLYESVLNIFP